MAQEAAGNPIEKRGFYRTMHMGGIEIHTRGLGAYYRKGWRQTGFTNRILHIEGLNVNHPKQYKTVTTGQNSSQGFYEGKINSVFFLRGSYGWQKTWFDKEVKRGVRVSTFLLFGPTIALAKPIYLRFNYLDERGERIERYDYDHHSANANIIKKAPFIHGVTETRIHPGIHVKGALNFEYSPDDETIRALETGFNFDAFYKDIPIMANTYNDKFYITLYVALHFGKRYF